MGTLNHKLEEFRHRLQPFLKDESAIKALQSFITNDKKMTRGGMYLLEITKNRIENEEQNLFLRIPQEAFGGLSEGGRRNVQASLIARAENPTGRKEQGDAEDYGFTKTQKAVKSWAERDGCWSETPDQDLGKKGLEHLSKYDGSEAHVFTDNKKSIYKTLEFSHYEEFQQFLDNITIRNKTFPETAMTVLGFGTRDELKHGMFFVCTVRQPYVKGHVSTDEEIKNAMEENGYDLSNNGIFWISRSENLVIHDVFPTEFGYNAITDEDGNVLIFDCDARLKCMNVEHHSYEWCDVSKLLVNKDTNRYDAPEWELIFGKDHAKVSDVTKGIIVKELRTKGEVTGLVNGKRIFINHPIGRSITVDGVKRTIYDGAIHIGEPMDFRQEHIYQIPDLKYDEKAVEDIKSNITKILPETHEVTTYLYHQGYRTKKDQEPILRQLERKGRVEGLINGKILQADPEKPGNVLVSSPENIEFMLWTHNGELDTGEKITRDQMKELAIGNTVILPSGNNIFFHLDKGRLEIIPSQLKLRLTKDKKETKKSSLGL